jgi:hypothetical protein
VDELIALLCKSLSGLLFETGKLCTAKVNEQSDDYFWVSDRRKPRRDQRDWQRRNLLVKIDSGEVIGAQLLTSSPAFGDNPRVIHKRLLGKSY